MGTKANPGTYDCYAAATDDEPLFVLRAKDPLAPDIVRLWAKTRQILNGRTPRVIEAEECAAAMEEWNRNA